MKPVFLTGYRGSGKSTVGRLLARRLDLDFCDLDRYLCSAQNKTVAEIVKEKGWDGFRKLESAALMEASAKYGAKAIFATGGGAVLAQANREHMLKNGVVIWLNAPLDILHARLSRRPDPANRPGLTNASLLSEIRSVLEERLPLYEQCHHQVNASVDPDGVCAQIMQILNRASQNN